MDHANRGGAAWGEDDAFGAQVAGVWSALEVVEALELAEEVVEGLFADPQPGRPGQRACTLRSRVLDRDRPARWLTIHAHDGGFAAFMRGTRDGVEVEWDISTVPADGGLPASEAIVRS